MIRLFVSDIDGCLAEPYQPYSLAHFQILAGYARAAGGVHEDGRSPVLPSLTLCSGRPYPYVEAMTQVLGIRVPVLFESGGGLFDPVTAQVTWHPLVTAELEERLEDVRRWMRTEAIRGTRMSYDIGKRTQVGIIGPDPAEVAERVPLVEAYVAEHHPDMRVFHTPVSIDVLPPGIDKREGLRWLGEQLGIAPADMAYMGDTNGDLEALASVGYSFAPANATPEVRARVDVVTRGAVIEGVLSAYRWCIAENERKAA
ncbi:haloacid dehalogenase [Rhodothermaceae bacterium RA]|nr:haloacid dehalogenase [Rhodothermaceae bacterium RA]